MRSGPSAILAYHSLDDSGSAISTSPGLFRRQMEFLASSDIPVLPLDKVLLQPGTVAITFDDGYRNVLDHAIPVLEALKLPATVFVVSDYCGKRNNWRGHKYGLAPDLPLLGWDELSALPTGISVGAHTMTHAQLNRLLPQDCERELRGCQMRLEQQLSKAVQWLAYPYGAVSPAVRALAARYFDLAVGTSLGFLSPPASHRANSPSPDTHQDDRFDLPRIDSYYLRGHFPLEKLFDKYTRWYIEFRNLLRKIRRGVLR